MIENSEKISNIAKRGEEFFFIYKGYIWSIIMTSSSAIFLTFYPRTKNVSELTEVSTPRKDRDFVVYSASEIKTKEAEESFNGLYSIIKEKFYGIDKMFNDIINDNDKKNDLIK